MTSAAKKIEPRMLGKVLTLSWRRPLSYRNQSIDLWSKSIDRFLFDNGLRHERVNTKNKWNMKLREMISGRLISISYRCFQKIHCWSETVFSIPRGVQAYSEPSHIWKTELFAKIINDLKRLTTLVQKLHLMCLTRFWMNLWNANLVKF